MPQMANPTAEEVTDLRCTGAAKICQLIYQSAGFS